MRRRKGKIRVNWMMENEREDEEEDDDDDDN